ncbi:MAG: MFS transporter [Gammaproteobacteria bacterium]
MIHSVWAIGSLLLSVGLLLFGHGIHLTLLPLVAEARGWSAGTNAMTTSAYFLGFGAGCLIVPRWLLLIGHIRVFGVLVAVATASLLALTLAPAAWQWLALRFCYGIAISGIYLTVESWLNAETQARFRGTVLAVYALVTLVAMFGAQLLLQGVSIAARELLVLAAICLSLAALPIGLTRRQAPRVVASPHFRLATLMNAAHLPAVAAGVLAGTFWALAPVWTARLGFNAQEAARFMAAVVGGGMLAVYPLGWLSDRFGRAQVLGALGFTGVVATLGFLILAGRGEAPVMLYGVAFGALTMPLYALCVALANDNSSGRDFVEIGSMMIMANALGMVVGPLVAGALLSGRAPAVLPWFWTGAFAALGIFATLARPSASATATETAAFELVPRTVPEALVIDPRSDEPAADAAEEAVAHGCDDADAGVTGDAQPAAGADDDGGTADSPLRAV